MDGSMVQWFVPSWIGSCATAAAGEKARFVAVY